MRKLFIILMILAPVSMFPASELSAEGMIGELRFLSVPVDHEYVSVNPGISYSAANPVFPIIGISMPFAVNYYMTTEVGAGSDVSGQGTLTLFSLGAGYRDVFPGFDDLFFDMGVSYRDINAIDYHSSILSGEFLLEQAISKVHIGVGIGLNIQDYQISGSDIYPDIRDRLQKLILKVQFRSPFGNLAFKGMPDAVVAGISWTLRLEE